MSLLKRISGWLSPDPETGDNFKRTDSDIATDEVTVAQILSALKNHFNASVKKLSTDYNYLYHTSFTIYIKASNYSEISDSLPFIAGGAEKMLVALIKERAKSITGYRPHSQYWQFQLVEIPADAKLKGVSEEDMENGAIIQISSTLFPPSEGGDAQQSGGSQRVVTTVQGVNSLRAIRNCINPEILNKLYLYEKDRIKLELRLDEQTETGFGKHVDPFQPDHKVEKKSPDKKSGVSPKQPTPYFATLVAEDGEFLDGASDKKIHTVAITADEVHVSGRSSMRGTAGVETVRVNSDRILTPHVTIRRNPANGQFNISAIGPTSVNERTIESNTGRWYQLPNNSTIILDDEVQIRFKLAL